jgi:Coenzyme PQQ synthesis protein D (PqqD)
MTREERNPTWAADVRPRKVRGELLLAGNTEVYKLTEVAADIWQLADGTRSVAEIATALTERYDVPEDTALRDVRALMDELDQARLLTWVSRR